MTFPKNPPLAVIAGTAGAALAVSLGYARVVSHRRGHSLSGALLRRALRGAWREVKATTKDGRVRAQESVIRFTRRR
jgi:predicted GNAT family N-acyltransferase